MACDIGNYQSTTIASIDHDSICHHICCWPTSARFIGAIVGLVALMLWVIQQIAEANKADAAAQRPAPAALPQRRPAAQARPQPAGQQADPLRNQVEEFLRRAGQGSSRIKAPQQPRRRPPPAQEIEVLLDDDRARRAPTVGQPLRQADGGSVTRPQRRSAAEPTSDRRAARSCPQAQDVAERADERAAARAETLAKQASQLGPADRRRRSAIRRSAQGQVRPHGGHAGRQHRGVEPSWRRVDRASPAAQIAAMLANPDGVRQAIVLNEILRRPSDRW